MMYLPFFTLLLVITCLSVTQAFKTNIHALSRRASTASSLQSKGVISTTTLFSSPAPPGPEIDDRTKGRIEDVINTNTVVLFMKGNKIFPQCGFSNTACRILDAIETPYETVNVLDDEQIRAGIKVFSMWPTIPQLYVNGEFVGGSDIMIEMYQNGELAELIELANAS